MCDVQINWLENFEVNIRKREKISVRSLGLKKELTNWIRDKSPEETCRLLQIHLTNVLNKDGLEDFMFHLVEIDRPDLMKIVLTSADMCLLYCTTELNHCWRRAQSKEMREVLTEQINELMSCYTEDY